MKILRFLFKELFLQGILFALGGTALLAGLYLISIGAPPEAFSAAARSFFQLLGGAQDFTAAHPGFSAGEIIASGAAVTLPLALISLAVLTFLSLHLAALSVSAQHKSTLHGNKGGKIAAALVNTILSVFAACPLFAGLWVMAHALGSSTPLALIALVAVFTGGLAWDGSRFLAGDMLSQSDSTHATVFGTMGNPIGSLFPLPGSWSGYLFTSSLPRYLPYLAGKVPAIIGAVTIGEIVFSFPGLGSTLLDALLATNTDLLVAAVFILLCINAVVTFAVKTILFVMYPRWYEKAV